MTKLAILPNAVDLRRRGNTFKAMLADTRDLLETLKYASEEDEEAAKAQVEGINELLAGEA